MYCIGDFETGGRRQVHTLAWVVDNSGGRTHPVREAVPGRNLEDSKNSFGLIHPVGNVWIRSAEGALRGGSFDHYAGRARSSHRFNHYLVMPRVHEFGEFRHASIGIRLVEDL